MATVVKINHTRGVGQSFEVALTTPVEDIAKVTFRVFPENNKGVTALDINSVDHEAAFEFGASDVTISLDVEGVAKSSTGAIVPVTVFQPKRSAYLMLYEVTIETTEDEVYVEQRGTFAVFPGTSAPAPVGGGVTVDYSVPEGALVVDAGAAGDYSTLSAAIDAIVDASSNNRRQIAVRGTVTETAQINAKNFVDVLFLDGAVLNCNSTSSSNKIGVMFTSITDAVWKSYGMAEIRRSSGSGLGNNWAVQVINASQSGRVLFENLMIRNLVHTSIRNYGIQGEAFDLVGCKIYGAGSDRPYGALIQLKVNAKDSEFYGGDTTIGGVGGNLAIGLVPSSAGGGHTGLIENCRGYGGNCGVGGEAYGAWIFGYAGQGSGQLLSIFKDCEFWGGIAANYTDGINLHKSATAHLINCWGISGANGNGITAVGQTDNNARFLVENCTGISRATDNNAVNKHGLGMYEATRDRIIGGTFVGSPFVESCGLYFDQAQPASGSAATLPARAKIKGATFIGGGAGMEAQTRTTQQSNSHAVRVNTSVIGVDFSDCEYISNDVSAPIYIESTATLANLLFSGGTARSGDPATTKAMVSESAWSDAAVYGMTLVGGVTNVTPPVSPTMVGTNYVP